MKKAVLLNDTSARFHHGCSRVTRRIKTLLANRGISLIASSPAHSEWRNDAAFREALAVCDVVIINGEGTIHDGAKGGRRLLAIVNSPERRGRPVALINALWQNNPSGWGELAERCAVVAVRDSQSAAELEAAGVSSVRLMPDLSLTGAFPEPESEREKIIIGDSVRHGSRRLLARAAQEQKAIYLPTKTLQAQIWKNRHVSALLWRSYTWVWAGKVPKFCMARDDEAYIRTLQTAKSHLTGRFHGVCLSALTETPFLALVSKTSKVQTLLKDIGLDKARLLSDSDLAANLSTTAPPFRHEELLNIRSYIELANRSAEKLFDDIWSMA